MRENDENGTIGGMMNDMRDVFALDRITKKFSTYSSVQQATVRLSFRASYYLEKCKIQ
jgi:hypothetical protein